MRLGSYPAVDPRSVRAYYTHNKLMTDLIDKCNQQEFRYIDGFGKGHFLLTHDITTETASFTVGSRTVSLKIIDKIWLEHPDKSDLGLYVYVTAEPKYYLRELVVSRNYNITIDKSLSLDSVIPTIYVYEPGGTPLTMSQVLSEIAPAGYTVSFNTTDIVSYDIAIEGMTVLAAIDHLCSIYGWVWTVIGSVIHIWDIEPGTPPDPLNDIQSSVIDPQITDIAVSFPYYDYPGYRKGTQEYYEVTSNTTGQGLILAVCDPYYPAISKLYGAVHEDDIRNTALLTTRQQYIKTRLELINQTSRYVEKLLYEAPSLGSSTPPQYLSEVYGDWGDGPRSIYRSIPFPYVQPKIPVSKARYANNWRGTLAHTYTEAVSYFVVLPVYGIDGKVPSGLQRVENIYEWDYGEVGWKVRVEWNPELGQWEAIQQEYHCPPNTSAGSSSSGYNPPDYDPPYYYPGE